VINMSGECTESTRADQEIGVVVSFDRETYTAFVPALDLTLQAKSLVGLRALVTEAVTRQLAGDGAAFRWRYEPLVGRDATRTVDLPAQRDPSADDATSPRRKTYTQAMVDRKLDELRQRGR